MCTSASTSRHWPRFTSCSASSGSPVARASYPISAITAVSISNCAKSSSRIHGVKADFGDTISTVFDDAIPTMLYLLATFVPFRPLSPRPLLEFPNHRFDLAIPLEIQRLLLARGQPSLLAAQRFPMGCPVCFALAFESPLLPYFVPERVPLFPLRHTAAAIQQEEVTFSPPDSRALSNGA